MNLSDAPTFTIAVGPHCENQQLRQLAKQLCIELCSLGHRAVDISNERSVSTSYTNALATSSWSIGVFGHSAADLRGRSQRVRDRCEVYVPLVDLSNFLFEESWCELYYCLRQCCLVGNPVTLPIVDASLIRVVRRLQAAASMPLVGEQHEDPQQQEVDAVVDMIRGTFVEVAALNILPWLFQSSFFLTTDSSVSELSAKLMNFATQLELGCHVAPHSTIWDNFKVAFGKHSERPPNSAVTKVLMQLSVQGPAAYKTLTTLDLKNCVLSDAGIYALADVLHRLPCIEVLNLRGNNVRDGSCHHLTTYLLHHPSIVSLDLSDNKIADGGLTSVYFMIEGCSRITNVNLDENIHSSVVWMNRVARMLQRNQRLAAVAQAACNHSNSSLVRHSRAMERLPVIDAAVLLVSPSMHLSIDILQNVDSTLIKCRLGEGKVPHRTEDGTGQTAPLVEVEFDLMDGCTSSTSALGKRTWSSDILLGAAAQASLHVATSTMLLNVGKINGQKLPLLYNGQRCAAGLFASSAREILNSNGVSSWADIAVLLATMSFAERRDVVIDLSAIKNWSPAPTFEVLLLLVLDLMLNLRDQNEFSVALGKVAGPLNVSLRTIVQDAKDSDAANSSATTTVSALSARPSSGSYFTETSFIVSVTKGVEVLAASATQLYRPQIDRCVGNLANEIKSLLQWSYKQIVDPASIETDALTQRNLGDAYKKDVDDDVQRRSSIQMRVTKKWTGSSVATVQE